MGKQGNKRNRNYSNQDDGQNSSTSSINKLQKSSNSQYVIHDRPCWICLEAFTQIEKDLALPCGFCHILVHQKCLKYDDAVFNFFKKSSGLYFYCNSCNPMVEQFLVPSKRISICENDIVDLGTRVDILEAKNDSVKQQPKSDISDAAIVKMQDVLQQQQHQHPMQMQQGEQQQMVPGQTMIGARPMVMHQQQGGPMVMPNNYQNFIASLPIDIRQKIMQEPLEKRPALLRKIMDMQQQNQHQRMTAAARPQQPGRHLGMIPGQPQLQLNMNVLPQQCIYDSLNQPSNQPESYIPVNQQPGSQLPGQQNLQPHQQQPVNPYSHPACPSPGGFSNLAYPSPSPVHPLSSGMLPGYAAANASPGYPNMPIMSQKLLESSSLLVNSVEQTSSAIGASADDAMYKEKIRELQIYMDPLKQCVSAQNKVQQFNKIQQLIDILEGHYKVPYDVLLKCEEGLIKATKSKETLSKKIKTEIKTEVDDLDDSCESAAKSEPEKCDNKIIEKPSSSIPLMIQCEVAWLKPKFRIIK